MIRDLKFLNQDEQYLFDEYTSLQQDLKDIQNAIDYRKQLIFEKFDGNEIISNENNLKWKITTTLTTRKTLDVDELLKYIDKETLAKCYKTTTTPMRKITIGVIKKVEETKQEGEQNND